MSSERISPRSLERFTDDLLGRGRCTFTKQEAIGALQISDNAFRKAAHRLIREKHLLRVVNEFYAVIPAEYRPTASLPPTHFIDSLMKFREQPYYVGLLSAAGFHGAAHQSPQELQVITSAPMPMIRTARARVRFFTKRDIAETTTLKLKSSAGYILVSTPEETAFDLLRYPHAGAGLNNIATVLIELSEKIDPKKLAMIGEKVESFYIQRLGYLLEYVGAAKIAEPLIAQLKKHRWDYAPLRAGKTKPGDERNPKWRVIVNEKVEADL